MTWRDDAACRGMDVNLWFAADSDPATEEAQTVCIRCPVKAKCLEVAMSKPERFGVWGGQTATQRRRSRARPPTVHGTATAYRRHLAVDEDPCPACTAAYLAARARKRAA